MPKLIGFSGGFVLLRLIDHEQGVGNLMMEVLWI
jgi:hypothetical protein